MRKKEQYHKRILGNKNSSKYFVLSFLIPFLFMSVAFFAQNVHPFGNKTILTIDLYHQYAPFLSELRYILANGKSIFYSPNIGLGINFWAAYANVLASPFNLLVLLLPEKNIYDVIAFTVCLKAGLSGFTAALLLRNMDESHTSDLTLSVFPSFYALCGWMTAYFWNIMWLDALYLLPLVVLGLRKLIIDKSVLLYVVTLFLAIWSNYFAAFFLCLFLVIYFPVMLITNHIRKAREIWRSLLRFITCSLLAGAMTAVLTIPTLIALQESSAIGDMFPTSWAFYHTVFRSFSRYFVTSAPAIFQNVPNVYTGVIVVLLFPLFFLCKKIERREKLCYGILVIFMYLSFQVPALDFIWHAFHYPNSVPFRESFIMSFLLVLIAYRVVRNLSSFSILEISVCGTVSIFYLIVYQEIVHDGESGKAMLLTALFVIAYTAIARAVISAKQPFINIGYILCCVMLIEISLACYISIDNVSRKYSFAPTDSYGKYAEQILALSQKEEISGTDDYTRVAITPSFMSTTTGLYHIKGIDTFISTEDESFIKFMGGFGLNYNGINAVTSEGLTLVSADLLGIDYFVGVDSSSRIPYGLPKMPALSQPGCEVFKNEDALSVGYVVTDDILPYQLDYGRNPFDSTNALLHAMGTAAVYENEELTVDSYQNAALVSGDIQGGYYFAIQSESEDVVFHITPDSSTIGDVVYLFFNAYAGPTVTVSRTDPTTGEKYDESYYVSTNAIFEIGVSSKDMQITATFSAGVSGFITIRCATLNKHGYAEMVKDLSLSELEVEAFDSQNISGTVDVKKDGVLLLTIPYDKGWSATVDGAETEIDAISNALMGIRLSEGQHTIALHYELVGLRAGIIVSTFSFIVFFCMLVYSAICKNHPSRLLPGRNQEGRKFGSPPT